MIRFHPYRTSAAKADAAPERDRRELVVPFGVLWIISLWRVLSLVAAGATFGVTDTIALLFVIALPWLLFRAR